MLCHDLSDRFSDFPDRDFTQPLTLSGYIRSSEPPVLRWRPFLSWDVFWL